MAERLTFEEILADPENLGCKCQHDGTSYPSCQYRFKCAQCIIIHKSEGGLPTCIREFASNEQALPDMKTRAENEAAWLSDPKYETCVCTVEIDGKPCELRGKCKECIAVHRYYKNFPVCVAEYHVLKTET